MLRSLIQWYRHWLADREARSLSEAAERHARVGSLPRHEFCHQGGRLDKVRFLRREYMFVEWSSWQSALRED